MGKNIYSLGRWISILYRYGQCYLDKELKNCKELKTLNLSSGQFVFLGVLLNKDGVSQEYLSKVVNIDKATTARAIKKLEEEGYVIRKIDPADKRTKIVYLTEKGAQLKPLLQKLADNWTDILTSGFDEKEKKLVFELLEKMSRNAADYIKGSKV